MSKSEEMLRMERDLNEQPELAKKLGAEYKRIYEAGEAQGDGEIMVQAAAALGYTITLEELERAAAEMHELDPAEMDAVAGGFGYTKEDEKGHEVFCWTGWHCYTVTMHTEANLKNEHCWSDYTCFMINKGDEDEITLEEYNLQRCGKEYKKQRNWFGKED